MQYRLYQDGEINFTLQDPDNRVTAIFAVHYSPEGYFTNSPENSQKEREKIYLGIDKKEAIARAYTIAKDFTKQLDSNFQDRTQIGELERKSQQSEPQRVIKLKEILTQRITREQLGNMQKKI